MNMVISAASHNAIAVDSANITVMQAKNRPMSASTAAAPAIAAAPPACTADSHISATPSSTSSASNCRKSEATSGTSPAAPRRSRAPRRRISISVGPVVPSVVIDRRPLVHHAADEEPREDSADQRLRGVFLHVDLEVLEDL